MKKILLVLVFLIAVIGIRAQKDSNPNIVWIVLEDISPQFVGCYGNEDVKTPNIDQLASQGVVFIRAYSNATVCAASRSTIITGVRNEALGTGNHRSRISIPDTICGFPSYLKQKGYYTANIGKTDYNTSNSKAIIKSAWDLNAGGKKKGWDNRKNGQPFFCQFNVFACHQSRTMTMPFAAYEELIYKNLPDSLKTEPGKLTMPPIYRNTPEMQKYLARAYNSVNSADISVGKIIDNLKKDGLYDETIIVLMGDHGEAMPRGKGSPIAYGHRVPFIIRFPEKYDELSPWKGANTSDELISFEDLAPSMLSIAGAEIPDYMHGRPFFGAKRIDDNRCLFGSRNRLDAAPGMMRSVMMGDYIYTRSFQPYLPMLKYKHYHDVADVTQTIRRDYNNGKLNKIQSSMLDTHNYQSLYNIKKDVWETNNLIDNKKFRALANQMQDSLFADMLKQNDAHLMPEYELNKIVENGALPYNIRFDTDLLPINEVIKVLQLIDCKKANAPALITYSKHPNKIVRYWAVVGLNSISDSLTEYQSDLETLVNDNYSPVAIEAASVLLKNAKSDGAVNCLKKYINSSSEPLSNQAIQMVQHLSNVQQHLFVSQLKEASRCKVKSIAYSAEVVLYYLNGDPVIMSGKEKDYYVPYNYFPLAISIDDKKDHNKLIGNLKQSDVENDSIEFSKNTKLHFDEEFFLTGEFSIGFDLIFKAINKEQSIFQFSSSNGVDQFELILKKGQLCLKSKGILIGASSKLAKNEILKIHCTYINNYLELYVNSKRVVHEKVTLNPENINKGYVGGLNGKINELKIFHFGIQNENQLERL